MPSRENAPPDDELMRQATEGFAEALGVLHQRFAPMIFGLTVQTLGRAGAEGPRAGRQTWPYGATPLNSIPSVGACAQGSDRSRTSAF